MTEPRQLQEDLEQLRVEDRQSSTGGSEGARLGRHEQVVYIPRERRCPKFSGRGTLSVEEWIEEAESCIRSRHMSKHDRALFLYDHLEGEARNEIKYRPSDVREDPTAIVNVLKEVFGCSRSYVVWQQRFFDRKQQANESLFEFSHALMELMEKIEASKPGCMSNSALVLRDQFCENVHDCTLRRELKRLVRANDEWSILDVRREAIRWVEEGQSGRGGNPRAGDRSNTPQYTSQCEAVLSQTSALDEIKEMVRKQQAQIDALMRLVPGPGANAGSSQPRRVSRAGQGSGGQLICFRCDQPGHIARQCPTVRPPADRPVTQLSPPTPNLPGN